MKLTMWRVVVVLNMHTKFRDSSLFPTKVLISLKALSNIARLFCGLSFGILLKHLNQPLENMLTNFPHCMSKNRIQ